ncbi:MAG TPA: hypothetical protein DDX89_00005, partial [Candidatus Omnitrophica bacterium]|nr:hypothetical protein [Candidatus Omnitrophota bacterium]
VPAHDRVARRGPIVRIPGALTAVTEEELALAGERLSRHPQFRAQDTILRGGERVVSVLLGGDTRHYELTTTFVDGLIQQVLQACDAVDGVCLVTSSRRTPPDVERLLQQRLDRHPRCRMVLLASRDPLNGTSEGMLGLARVVVVTGESISMVTEACASGRPVLVVDPPLRKAGWGRVTKPQRYVRQLARDGYAKPLFLRELNQAIQRAVAQPRATLRLDAYAAVRDAVARLL